MKMKFTLVFLLLLASCVKLPPPVTIQNEFVLNAEFDKAWDAAVDVITENNLPIKVIEKDSGVITTDFAIIGDKPSIKVRLTKLTNLPSSLAAWESGKYYLNFLVRRRGENQVSVRILSHIEAFEGFISRQAYVLPSNGNLELYFFAELQKKISYSGIGMITEEANAILSREVPQDRSARFKNFKKNSKNTQEEEQWGLKIIKFTKNSPAEKTGLKLNDVIVEIDGIETETKFDSYRLIGEEGSKVKLKILRDGNFREFELVRKKLN